MFMAALPTWNARAASGPGASESSASSAKEDVDEKQVAEARQEQQQLLRQIRKDVALMPAGSPERAQKERILAAIERRIADEDKTLARTLYMTSSDQSHESFGPYCAELRRRIEARGTAHFPQLDGHKIHGRVTLNLRIDSKGRLIETDLVRGSGNATLDRDAQELAGAVAPFGAFTPEMRRQADQIVFTASFNFTRQPDGAASAP